MPSLVWKYFEKVCADNDKAKCLLCNNIYSRKGRCTTALKNHLQSMHKVEWRLNEIQDMENIAIIKKQKEKAILQQSKSKAKQDLTLTSWINKDLKMSSKYLVRKHTHCSSILDDLLKDETFTDVILTAEGRHINAHRVILCLASPYFQEVLNKDSNAKNVIFFRDMKYLELKNLITFIYTGEVSIDSADLQQFLKTAELLKVTSLCEKLEEVRANASSGHSKVSTTILRPKRLNSNSALSPPPKSRKICKKMIPSLSNDKRKSSPSTSKKSATTSLPTVKVETSSDNDLEMSNTFIDNDGTSNDYDGSGDSTTAGVMGSIVIDGREIWTSETTTNVNTESLISNTSQLESPTTNPKSEITTPSECQMKKIICKEPNILAKDALKSQWFDTSNNFVDVDNLSDDDGLHTAVPGSRSTELSNSSNTGRNVKNSSVVCKKVKYNEVNSDRSSLFRPAASASPLHGQNHGEESDLSFERWTEDVSFKLAIGDSSFVYDRNDEEDSDQIIANLLTPKLIEESSSSLPPLSSFVAHEEHEVLRRNPHLESFSYPVEPEAENKEPKAGPSGIRPNLNRQNIEEGVSNIYNFNPSERLIENEENESSFESIQSMSAERTVHESRSNVNFNNNSLSVNSGSEDNFQNYYETQRQACYIDPFEQPLTVTRRIFGNSHYEVFENPHYVNKRFRNINVSYCIRIYPIRYEDNVPVPTAYTILNYANSAFEAVHRSAQDLNLRIRPSGGVANITVIGGGLNIKKGKFEAFSDNIMIKFIDRITDAMTSDTSILFKDLQIKIQFIAKQTGTGPDRADPSLARKFQHLHLSKTIYRGQEGACFFLATQHNILYKQKLAKMLAEDNKGSISGIMQRNILKDAQALAAKAGCNFQLACGKDEVLQIARANNLRIVVFTIEMRHEIEKIHILINNNCPANSKQTPVTLLLHDGCYYSIVEPGLLLKNAPKGSGFCAFCLTFKCNLLAHFSECNVPCKNCFSFNCKNDDIAADPRTCPDCFDPFDNRVCFNIHKAKKLCIKRYMCRCGLFITNPNCRSEDKNQKHKCGNTLCFRCFAFVPSLTTHCCLKNNE